MAAVISRDGSTMAIGAPLEDGATGGVNPFNTGTLSNSGAVYVYARVGGQWQFSAFIKAPAPQAGSAFGYSIALSADGSRLAVRARDEVDFYGRQTAWAFEAAVSASTISGMATPVRWNKWISLSADGTRLAIPLEGKVSMLARSPSGTWSRVALVEQLGDLSSAVVSPDGAAVMALSNSSGGTLEVYPWGSTTRSHTLVGIAPATNGSVLNATMTISGDGTTLAVGMPESAPTPDEVYGGGVVALLQHQSDGSWVRQATVSSSNLGYSDVFGYWLSLSTNGDALVVGAPSEDSASTGLDFTDGNGRSESGAVYVFRRTQEAFGPRWTQVVIAKASNPGADDHFGRCVAMAPLGDSFVVGAYGEDGSGTGFNPASNDFASNSGAFYIVR